MDFNATKYYVLDDTNLLLYSDGFASQRRAIQHSNTHKAAQVLRGDRLQGIWDALYTAGYRVKQQIESDDLKHVRVRGETAKLLKDISEERKKASQRGRRTPTHRLVSEAVIAAESDGWESKTYSFSNEDTTLIRMSGANETLLRNKANDTGADFYELLHSICAAYLPANGQKKRLKRVREMIAAGRS